MISLLIIIGLLGCNNRTDTRTENTFVNMQQIEDLGKSFKDTINNSVGIQYGTNNIELTKVFSNRFITEIQDKSNFYKKDLKPYKIISINHNKIKDTSIENL